MRHRPYWMKFLAPDVDTATPAATPAPAPDIAPTSIIEAPTRTQSTILSPRKGLGLPSTPKAELDAMAKTMRDTQGKTSTPLTPKKTAEPLESTIKPDGEKKVEPVKPPVPPVPPAAPPKIKVGQKEFTPEELEAFVANAEKAAKPPETPKPAEVPPVVDEKAAKEADAKRDSDFLTAERGKYSMNEEDYDTLLSGGPKAIELFTSSLAKVELNTRKWLQDAVNPILEDLHARIEPVLSRDQTIRTYESTQQFATDYPDLAPHSKAVEQIRAQMLAKFGDKFTSMSVADQNAEVATNTRNFMKNLEAMGLSATPAAAAAAAAVIPTTPPPATPAPAPRPEPPKGHAPSSVASKATNPQRDMAMAIRNAA